MKRLRFLFGVLLAACAPGAFAQSAIELLASLQDLSAPVPAVEAAMMLGDERLVGDTGAVRWSVEARGWASMSGSLDGVIGARTELSHAVNERVTVGWISLGGTVGSESGIGARAEIGASFVANGDIASFTFSPWCAGQAFLDPLLEMGASVRLSLLAEAFVMEPGLAASFVMTSPSAWTLSFEPGVGLSWYPAFPLTVSIGARWAATVDAGGVAGTEWGATAALSGAPLSGVLVSGSAAFVQSAEGSSVTADMEISLQLWSREEQWLSLPLRIAAVFSEQTTPALSAALGVRFAW